MAQPRLSRNIFDVFAFHRAILESGLPSRARHVAHALAVHADAAGLCFPSMATLAAETGLSRRTVCDALDDLARWQFLDRARRSGRRGRASNVYTLHPAHWPCPGCGSPRGRPDGLCNGCT